MVDAADERLPAGDRCSECRQREPGIDAAADGIADDASRPGVKNGCQIDGGSAVHRPLARRALVECPTVTEIPMYDQTKLSELVRFARVDAGSTVIDVTQATATGRACSPTSWDPKGGSTASCRPKSPT